MQKASLDRIVGSFRFNNFCEPMSTDKNIVRGNIFRIIIFSVAKQHSLIDICEIME